MTAILRASGAEFDVDRFCASSKHIPWGVYRRGEPRFKPDAPRFEESGIHIPVSDAEFGDLPQQVEDAIAFLRLHRDEVARLRGFPGVEDARIDFANTRREVFCQCDFLPEEFIRLAGELGLGVEISLYPPIDDSGSAG